MKHFMVTIVIKTENGLNISMAHLRAKSRMQLFKDCEGKGVAILNFIELTQDDIDELKESEIKECEIEKI
jgi:hypothetical protein